MTSKRAKEQKKDDKREQNLHKVIKGKKKVSGGRDSKDTKTANITKSSGEKRNTTKSSKANTHTKQEIGTKSRTEKQSSEKTLIIDDDEVEGMTVPPKTDQSSSPWSQSPRPAERTDQGSTVKPTPKPAQSPPLRQRPASSPTPKPTRPRVTAKSTAESKTDASGDDDDDEDSSVKQFSFPSYKILSGASVAPVRMLQQKVVINQSREGNKRSWATCLTGLFQNSKLTLKIRMLRLLLIWIFFRVLNKQTAWLSDVLGVGIPDEELPGPKAKPPPGERFIRVFREGDPNPYHVRVKRPL